MENSIKITLIVVSAVVILALIAGFVIYQAFPHYPSGNVITVNGNSELKVSPDVVSIYFNVETNGSTSKEANDKNSEIVDKILTALIKQGFDREDLETVSFNIYEDQRWENGRTKSYGYKASHQIRVVMDSNSVSKIGAVIDAGVDEGAMLSYINFELSSERQNEYKAEALKQAGVDAKTKAEAIAEGLGKKLGDIQSISTSDWGYNPWNIYTASYGGVREDVAMAKEATTNIQPGTQQVTGYVTVVYKLR